MVLKHIMFGHLDISSGGSVLPFQDSLSFIPSDSVSSGEMIKIDCVSPRRKHLSTCVCVLMYYIVDTHLLNVCMYSDIRSYR